MQGNPARRDPTKSGSKLPRSKLALVALVALGFLLIPTALLEALPSFCLFRNLLGMDCPGCGMIRAISCAFHGEFLRAWHFNRSVVVVLPLLVSAGLRKQ